MSLNKGSLDKILTSLKVKELVIENQGTGADLPISANSSTQEGNMVGRWVGWSYRGTLGLYAGDIFEDISGDGVTIDGLTIKDKGLVDFWERATVDDLLNTGTITISVENFWEGESSNSFTLSQGTEGSNLLLDYSTLTAFEKGMLNELIAQIIIENLDFTNSSPMNNEIYTIKHYYSKDGGTTWILFATQANAMMISNVVQTFQQVVFFEMSGVTGDIKYQCSIEQTGGTFNSNIFSLDIPNVLNAKIGNI